MEAISFLDPIDTDDMKERVDRGTHIPADQIYLLNQAADIALVTLMEIAMEFGHPEKVAETVADCLTLIILAAPDSERKQVEDEIMGLYKP
jgi:hypothetical protein